MVELEINLLLLLSEINSSRTRNGLRDVVVTSIRKVDDKTSTSLTPSVYKSLNDFSVCRTVTDTPYGPTFQIEVLGTRKILRHSGEKTIKKKDLDQRRLFLREFPFLIKTNIREISIVVVCKWFIDGTSTVSRSVTPKFSVSGTRAGTPVSCLEDRPRVCKNMV